MIERKQWKTYERSKFFRFFFSWYFFSSIAVMSLPKFMLSYKYFFLCASITCYLSSIHRISNRAQNISAAMKLRNEWKDWKDSGNRFISRSRAYLVSSWYREGFHRKFSLVFSFIWTSLRESKDSNEKWKCYKNISSSRGEEEREQQSRKQ